MKQLRTHIFTRLPRLRVLGTTAAVLVLAAFAANGGRSFDDAPPEAQAAPPLAFTFGQENSWIRIQNIGGASANVTVSYFDGAGNKLAQ